MKLYQSLMSDGDDRSEHTAWQIGYFNFLVFLDSITVLINETRMIEQCVSYILLCRLL